MSAAGRMPPVRTRLAWPLPLVACILLLLAKQCTCLVALPSPCSNVPWPKMRRRKGASHSEGPRKGTNKSCETHGEKRGAKPLISNAARITQVGHADGQQRRPPCGCLSPGHQPSRWNMFRLLWGGSGKQVVQENPRNATSRRTRWALRVLRYLSNS
ncbi:hypothetical protein V8C42DRAFT_85414 [Trichoderma barbatum]